VLFGTMVMLNLFIGVIMNGMNEAQKETAALDAADQVDPPTLQGEIDALTEKLTALQDHLAQIRGLAVATDAASRDPRRS
jgi:voltage-gated sodium channel